MFCEQCGAELEQDAHFCSMCGSQVGEPGADSSGQQIPQGVVDRHPRILTSGLIAGLVVVLGGTVLWTLRSEKTHLTDDGNSLNAVTQESKTELSRNNASVAADTGLSRSSAKKLMQDKLEKNPYALPINIGEVFVGWKEFGKTEQECLRLAPQQALASQGYLSVSPGLGIGRPGGAPKIICNIQLADKAKPFVLRIEDRHDEGQQTAYVNAADAVVVEITGITKPASMFGQTICQVDYVYKYEINPLGLILNEVIRSQGGPNRIRGTPDFVPTGTETESATFVLYDDGWRLK